MILATKMWTSEVTKITNQHVIYNAGIPIAPNTVIIQPFGYGAGPKDVVLSATEARARARNRQRAQGAGAHRAEQDAGLPGYDCAHGDGGRLWYEGKSDDRAYVTWAAKDDVVTSLAEVARKRPRHEGRNTWSYSIHEQCRKAFSHVLRLATSACPVARVRPSPCMPCT